jgi:hypothetical protein
MGRLLGSRIYGPGWSKSHHKQHRDQLSLAAAVACLGCQIFRDTIHIPKRCRIYQMSTKLQKGYIKSTNWP